MATIDRYCGNSKCGGFPLWFAVDAILATSRCPMCGFKLRFRCSACGHRYDADAATLSWCPFCGEDLDQLRSA